MRNLFGDWHYEEEYEFGYARGKVQLNQNGNKLTGMAFLNEVVDDDEIFDIHIKLEGTLEKNKVFLKGTHFEIVSPNKDLEYNLDSWEGIVNSAGDIVGHTIDTEGLCGVFMMKKPHA